jgi:hypothetical protein
MLSVAFKSFGPFRAATPRLYPIRTDVAVGTLDFPMREASCRRLDDFAQLCECGGR